MPLISLLQSYKLRNDKHMIALTQITNTQIFAFISVLVFKLLSPKVLFINIKLLKSRLLFKKKVNFSGTLRQNYKSLKCEIFRIVLKDVSDHLSVFFQFP